MTREQDKGFLSRWSQRKRAVAAGDVVAEEDPNLPPLAEVQSKIDPEGEEARLAELAANRDAAEAIDLEKLDYDSDYSAFFKEGVPTVLKQKAMRLLWRSNPVLANVDGLCDYDENFGDPALILEKFESAYRIGKGYLFEDDEESEEVADETVASSETESADDDLPVDEEQELADAQAEQEPVSTDENPMIEVVEQREIDLSDQMERDLAIEEAPVERPKVSLRRRLQFES